MIKAADRKRRNRTFFFSQHFCNIYGLLLQQNEKKTAFSTAYRQTDHAQDKNDSKSMKVLFVVQGEGRGHLTQALSLEQMLTAHGHQVVGMLVGRNKTRKVPRFFTRKAKAPVAYFRSPGFTSSHDNRRVGLLRSVAGNILGIPQYVASMLFLRRSIRESGADLVVNFYDVLCGLTYGLFRPEVPEVCIGHQYLFLHPDFRMPRRDRASQRSLLAFTRATCMGAQRRLALSLRAYPSDARQRLTVVPPLLRREVFSTPRHHGGYVAGYILNAGFAEDVKAWHEAHPEVPLRFFWDKRDAPEILKVDDTLSFHRLDDEAFLHTLADCRAYATTGGFESVCEAYYMGKPAVMVPAHVEQLCNATDAEREGVGILSDSFAVDRLLDFSRQYDEDGEFRLWANQAETRIVAALESVFEDSCSRSAWASGRPVPMRC